MQRSCLLCAAVLAAFAVSALGDVGAFLKDGDSAFGRGEYNMAIRLYTSAIEVDPKASLFYTKRAAAYIASRQSSQGLKDLNRAIENDEAFVQGYLHRGKLHRQMCSTAAAQRDFLKVLELRPGHKTATSELQESQKVEALLAALEFKFEKNELDGIQSDLQTLFDVAQDCVKAQLMDAKLHLLRNDWDQVVVTTGRLLKSDPSNLQALVMRGQGYFYAGDHDMAKRHFGEALKHDPDYKQARAEFGKVKDYDRKRQRAQTAASEQNWVEAEKLFAEALHVDQQHKVGNKGLWQGLGEARYQLGYFEAAEQAFQAVLTLTENADESAKAWLVRCLLAAEKWQDAVNKARDYVNEHQQSHELRQLLAEAEKRLKMSLRKDYYKILGVDKNAGDREIKRAYRDLAKQFHPDKVSGTEEDKKVAEAKFREIAESYEVLSDEEKRRRFDNGEEVEQHQHQQQQGHPFFHQGGQQFHFQWG